MRFREKDSYWLHAGKTTIRVVPNPPTETADVVSALSTYYFDLAVAATKYQSIQGHTLLISS